jgi:hypothetical protein
MALIHGLPRLLTSSNGSGRRSQRREVAGEFGPGGFDLSFQLVETGFNHD